MKNPMDKNKLGDAIPSRNQTKGQHPGITTAAGAPVTDNQDTMTSGKRARVASRYMVFRENGAFRSRGDS